MKRELLRIMKMPLYWLVIGGGMTIRLVFAYFDRLYRQDSFWNSFADFWNKIGAFTMAVLILVVLIRLFSMDREHGVQDVISSTMLGRRNLFLYRLFAVVTGACIGVSVLAAANTILSALFGQGIALNNEWIMAFLTRTGIALCGSVGLSVVAGSICDISKSQPVTLCICGIPFIISIFVNADVVRPFELFWFFRYGFFTELMRGRLLQSMLGFWVIWYSTILVLALAIAIAKRKERKEL